ncbi:LCP family protein required for cell wall assembly [Kitasatospora sp. MAP12-15]|uniref:LCP family protein n=1 Tax=unclassified Kitasatospora TaxID=2633591 RepID=UPI002475B7F1|nr:LCP family protein [Kitasatospora sp. MAP12-44]MDH6112804.1 LCP family protein required for cell wall assembly [Kitasatospora sp. MAP12-44]
MADEQHEQRATRRERRAAHRRDRSRRAKLLRAGAFTLAGLLLAGAGTAGYAYWRLNGNIKSVDIDAQLGSARPSAPKDGSFNILVLGSDSRAGANSGLAGGNTGGTARSDTAMVVHVNQNHTLGTVVSIPRDTLVARPACTAPDGSAVPADAGAMYNSAFEVGGAACAVKTTEQLTGLRMNHFVEIDFAGFAGFINAIGGATVTTTMDIHDPDSGLNLPAGTTKLNGDQALAFVRTRHGVGDGSDLGRIELQKEMVKSITKQVGSIGLFADPAKLWSVGDTLTKSITTDSALASVSALTGLGEELKGIGANQLTMVTLPVVTAPTDPNRVVEQLPAATQVWNALRLDQPVPQSITGTQPANPADSSPPPSRS